MNKKNIIFLDFDGVINTPLWGYYDSVFKNSLFRPKDGKLNNFQAISWLNELYRLIPYKIVVSSTWRYLCKDISYVDCLYNSGLNKEIEVLGCIPILENRSKSDEIKLWLSKNTNIINHYIIIDDIPTLNDLDSNLVKCDSNIGFGAKEFKIALKGLKGYK